MAVIVTGDGVSMEDEEGFISADPLLFARGLWLRQTTKSRGPDVMWKIRPVTIYSARWNGWNFNYYVTTAAPGKVMA